MSDLKRVNEYAQIVLKDQDEMRRLQALHHLAAYDDPRLPKLLARVSAQDPSPSVREAAAQMLRQQSAPADDESPDDSLRWTCPRCGAETTGAECSYCGAPAQAAPDPAQSRPASPRSPSVSGKTMLFNPRNQKFLEGRTSRPAGAFGLGFGVFPALFMVPFILAGVFVIAIFISQYQQYQLLAKEGVVTTGRVISRYFDPADDSEDSDSWYVTYTFTANQTEYQMQQSVGEERYNQLEQGGSVQVLYAPSNPDVAKIEGTNSVTSLYFLGGFAVVWNLIIGAVVVSMVVGGLRQNRLAQRGIVLNGEIIECRGETDSDGDYWLIVEYTFTPEGGSPIVARKQVMYNEAKGKRLPRYGTPVAVIYTNARTYDLL